MEEKLQNFIYINEDLLKEKNEIRKKIYEKMIYLKDYCIENENFLFQKARELFENQDDYEYQEFKKLTNKYYCLSKLTEAIKFYINNQS